MSDTDIDALIARARAARAAADFARAADSYGSVVLRLRQGPDTARLAHALRHLGDILREAGDPAAALPHLEEALRIRRADPAVAPLELANTLRPFALTCEALGRIADSATAWREASELYTAAHVPAGIAEATGALVRLGLD